MDGNFQLKKKAIKYEVIGANLDDETVVGPSKFEKALWGNNEEVEKYHKPGAESKDVYRSNLNQSLLLNFYTPGAYYYL